VEAHTVAVSAGSGRFAAQDQGARRFAQRKDGRVAG